MTDEVDFLTMKRDEIASRIAALKPMADEYARLGVAAEALDLIDSVPPPNGTAPAPAMTPPSAPTRKRKPAKRGGVRGRPKGSGTRGVQALAIVKESPGVTIPEIAERMAIKQNYLYRVLPRLAEDGLVAKVGTGWHPKDSA